MVNRAASSLLEGLFPNHCALCGLRSHRPIPLCRECEFEMPRNRHCCVRCALPLPITDELRTARICGSCLKRPPPYNRVIAPWIYGEYFGHLIHQWKFQRQRRMTALLSSLWRQETNLPRPVDALVPVPLHWRRQWHRGFNQSELLARQLLATCPELKSCKLEHRLVKRSQSTAAQSGMSARQRAGNLRGAFTVREPCDNLRVAIIDDVLTTGATVAAMADVLAFAGASYIEVWCLARTPAPGH